MRAPDGRRDLLQDVLLAAVDDPVDGIEAQAVEAKLLEPVQHVVNGEIAHRTDLVVDRGAPGRVLLGLEEALGILVQVVPHRAEVIVHHVEEHHEPAPVRLVDQALQIVGAAVGGVRGERHHAVVAPVARAGEVGERHQLDRGDPEVG